MCMYMCVCVCVCVYACVCVRMYMYVCALQIMVEPVEQWRNLAGGNLIVSTNSTSRVLMLYSEYTY